MKFKQEIKVTSDKLVKTVKKPAHAANIRRAIVENEKGKASRDLDHVCYPHLTDSIRAMLDVHREDVPAAFKT